ncbi:S58 family peptidase, partial [Oenococcus sp. UCMA 14587]|nr:S58 family peptidase [Oenococcus sp. UCMA 14587]
KTVIDRKGHLRYGLVDAAKQLIQQQPRYAAMVNQLFKQLGVKR